ncbi:hypothetical protein DFH09DRAFT_653706 [Mycena vulgaris]|nr:hypothetical protein DFH09DRAFT_653706 [Mycena vulgaris]
MASATLARLPLELERHVFELAAQSDRPTILHLLRVAHRVHLWIAPLLYTVLVLTNPDRTSVILDAVAAKPAPFLAATVRHVLVYSSKHSLSLDAIEGFIASCSGIVNLSLTMPGTGPRLLPLLGGMHLQRLGVDLGELFAKEDGNDEDPTVDLGHPLFASITHLDVFDELAPDDEHDPDWLTGLAALPALTHLSFSSLVNPETLERILKASTRIQILVVTFAALEADVAREFVRELDVHDPRLVVTTYKEYFADWEQGARGGDDIWVRAEHFLEQKRRGEIEANDHFLDAGDGDESASDAEDSTLTRTAVADYFLDAGEEDDSASDSEDSPHILYTHYTASDTEESTDL